MVNLSNVEEAIRLATDYIRRLYRVLSSDFGIVAEYPALPVSVMVRLDSMYEYVAPGLPMDYAGNYYTNVRFDLVKVEPYEVKIHFDVDNDGNYEVSVKLRDIHYDNGREATLEVTDVETKTGMYITEVYLAGKPCPASPGATVTVTRRTVPAMRFSVRHVNATTYWLARCYNLLTDPAPLWSLMSQLYHTVLGTDVYDLYVREIAAYYPEIISEDPESFNRYGAYFFWDAQRVNNETYWERMWKWLRSNYECLVFKSCYPAYPYKSKLVSITDYLSVFIQKFRQLKSEWKNVLTQLHLNKVVDLMDYLYEYMVEYFTGGDFFTVFEFYMPEVGYVPDVFGACFIALNRLARGDADGAYEIWKKIYEKWDGYGVRSDYTTVYSTVRLALTVAVGVWLAKVGKVSWDTVDDMVDVLLQLQWTGRGYVKTSIYTGYITRIDHIGGFLTSYVPGGSFAFAEYRPSIFDKLEEFTGVKLFEMPPEYIGPIPTNAETTLASLVALLAYKKYRY